MSNLEGLQNRNDFSDIAALNRRIYIWGRTQTTNELGEMDYADDALIKTIWANIIPQTGSLQKQQAETILANVTHKLKVRYSSGSFITDEMYIMYKGHRFDIKYILNPYFANQFLEIFCEEVMEQ